MSLSSAPRSSPAPGPSRVNQPAVWLPGPEPPASASSHRPRARPYSLPSPPPPSSPAPPAAEKPASSKLSPRSASCHCSRSQASFSVSSCIPSSDSASSSPSRPTPAAPSSSEPGPGSRLGMTPASRRAQRRARGDQGYARQRRAKARPLAQSRVRGRRGQHSDACRARARVRRSIKARLCARARARVHRFSTPQMREASKPLSPGRRRRLRHHGRPSPECPSALPSDAERRQFPTGPPPLKSHEAQHALFATGPATEMGQWGRTPANSAPPSRLSAWGMASAGVNTACSVRSRAGTPAGRAHAQRGARWARLGRTREPCCTPPPRRGSPMRRTCAAPGDARLRDHRAPPDERVRNPCTITQIRCGNP